MANCNMGVSMPLSQQRKESKEVWGGENGERVSMPLSQQRKESVVKSINANRHDKSQYRSHSKVKNLGSRMEIYISGGVSQCRFRSKGKNQKKSIYLDWYFCLNAALAAKERIPLIIR